MVATSVQAPDSANCWINVSYISFRLRVEERNGQNGMGVFAYAARQHEHHGVSVVCHIGPIIVRGPLHRFAARQNAGVFLGFCGQVQRDRSGEARRD